MSSLEIFFISLDAKALAIEQTQLSKGGLYILLPVILKKRASNKRLLTRKKIKLEVNKSKTR